MFDLEKYDNDMQAAIALANKVRDEGANARRIRPILMRKFPDLDADDINEAINISLSDKHIKMSVSEAMKIAKKAGYKISESHIPGYDPHFGGNDLQDAWNEFAQQITDDQLFIDNLLEAWREGLMGEFVSYVAGVKV
jgi:hypothetical protein